MVLKKYEILCVELNGRIGDPTNKVVEVSAISEQKARDKASIPSGYRSAGIREIIKVEGYQNFVVTE